MLLGVWWHRTVCLQILYQSQINNLKIEYRMYRTDRVPSSYTWNVVALTWQFDDMDTNIYIYGKQSNYKSQGGHQMKWLKLQKNTLKLLKILKLYFCWLTICNLQMYILCITFYGHWGVSRGNGVSRLDDLAAEGFGRVPLPRRWGHMPDLDAWIGILCMSKPHML